MDINSSLDNKHPHTHAPNSKGVNQREGFWATNAGFDLIVTLELHSVREYTDFSHHSWNTLHLFSYSKLVE